MFINELIVIEPGLGVPAERPDLSWIHIGLGVAMALVGVGVMFRWV